MPKQGTLHYCTLCGQNTEKRAWSGYRTAYHCSTCYVFLCVRLYPGLRKSCFHAWHKSQKLHLRSMIKRANPSGAVSAPERAENGLVDAVMDVTGTVSPSEELFARRLRVRPRWPTFYIRHVVNRLQSPFNYTYDLYMKTTK